MKTEHTQGPWKAHVAHESLNVVTDSVVTVDGLHVADVASYGASIATRNANARLIAAGPDLLAALQEIERKLTILLFERRLDSTDSAFYQVRYVRNLAISAIAKAEGDA
jgi:hypothetical protein